jgi:hypothetical protein
MDSWPAIRWDEIEQDLRGAQTDTPKSAKKLEPTTVRPISAVPQFKPMRASESFLE